MVKKSYLVNLLKLRVAIGLLGEFQQHSWWSSSFFSSTSSAFLAPMFSRTMFLARYHGVRSAAALVHDDHIGVGANVFHLFRSKLENTLQEIEGRDNAILLVTDLEALHPYVRIGAIESQLQGKFTIPTVFFYPGERTGKTRLKFLGFYPEDGSYRSVHVGG